MRPSRGRFFLPDENRTPGTHPVVVLSHDAWQRRFAADPGIVGRTVGLNGHTFTVIGIGPPKFAGTSIEHAAEFFAHPVSFGAATVLLLVVAAAASYVPSRRATRVDPNVALRRE